MLDYLNRTAGVSCVLLAMAAVLLATASDQDAQAAPRTRNEFRYKAGQTAQGRFERVDAKTWRQTDDNAAGFHYHTLVEERALFIELESKTRPGLKNRIYDRYVKRYNPATAEWDHKFDGEWVK
jgi:hypothetical protein